MNTALKEIIRSMLAVVLAFAVGGIVIQMTGYQALAAYGALARGAFGSSRHIMDTLLRATPLVLTGLSVAFAYKGGLFNIGGEGQFLVGGLLAVMGGALFRLPGAVHVPVCLLLGFLGGAAVGAIPGWLKARFGVHEVINTIMLNWICLNLVRYAVNGPFKDPSGQGSPAPHASALVNLHAGFIVAVLAAAVIAFILNRTVFGYEVKAVGYNPLAAESGGISISKNMILTFTVAGGLAGMAGALYYLGNLGRIPSTLDFPGYGFEGIAAALVGQTNPYGVVGAALLFGGLKEGGVMMQLAADVPKDLIVIVQALVILFMIAPSVVEALGGWMTRKKDPEGLELTP